MYDILSEVSGIAADAEVQHRIVGGAATKAMEQALRIDFESRYYETPEDITLRSVRENRTSRDVDVLLMTTDQDKVDRVATELRRTIGKYIQEISVFGIDRHDAAMTRPTWRTNLTDFTTIRTVTDDGRMYYVAYPFVAQIDPASHAEWQARIGDNHARWLTTLSPTAQQLAYETRSFSGVRGRDVEKTDQLQAIVQQARGKEILEIYDNPIYENWARLSGALLEAGHEFDDTDWLQEHSDMLDQRFTPSGAGLFIAANRWRLIEYLNEQEWAIEAAQGGGVLGKAFAPVRKRFLHEGDTQANGELPQDDAWYIQQAQRISEATGGIITPGNVLSTMSLLISVHVATHLDDMSGIAEMFGGELIDLVDGKVARKTQTASQLGATIDATFDKIKMAFTLMHAIKKGAIPPTVGAEIALQNLANAGLTLYGSHKGIELSPSVEGKHTRALQVASMASFMFANVLAERGDSTSVAAAKALRAIAWGTFGYQVKTGYKATKGYYKDFVLHEVKEESARAIPDPAERLFPYVA